MARGTTLGALITMTRLEANLDPNPALSLNVMPKMRLRLQQEQERLYDEYDWPFLRIRVDLALAAGERYYDVPQGMNLERIEKVDYQWALKWFPLTRGISPEHYNTYNSDADVRVDPAFRWDIHDTGSGPQVEIWPIPVSNGNLVRFTGIRQLKPFLVDADTADLDDQVLAGFVAAEMLSDPRAAGEKRAKAVDRLKTLKGLSTHTRDNKFNMNKQPTDDRQRRLAPLVAYVRNQ